MQCPRCGSEINERDYVKEFKDAVYERLASYGIPAHCKGVHQDYVAVRRVVKIRGEIISKNGNMRLTEDQFKDMMFWLDLVLPMEDNGEN